MQKLFWVDFENAPHIPVLLPIIRSLEKEGYKAIMTARNFSFTEELVRKHNLPAVMIGRGSGSKSSISKAFQVAKRVLSLYSLIRPHRKNIIFSIAHASRSQLFTARLLGITSVSLEDYEHSNQLHNKLSTYLLIPEPIPFSAFPKNRKSVIHYPGIKENIYLGGLELPRQILTFLHTDPQKVNVLFRPEGRTTHYRSATSEALQKAILKKLKFTQQAHLLIYPRDEIQKKEIDQFLQNGSSSYSFPPITDGPDLIASVDMVVGGGGTMTRESALIGVPSYTFFSGKWGGVDNYLESQGDLVAIRSQADVDSIPVVKRSKPIRKLDNETCKFITDFLLGINE